MAAATNSANNARLQPGSPIFNINTKLTELANINNLRYSISKIYNIRSVSGNNQLNSPRNVFHNLKEENAIKEKRTQLEYFGKIPTTDSLCNLTQLELATQLSRINRTPEDIITFLDNGWQFFYIETNNAMYIAYTDEIHLKKYKSHASCIIAGGRHKYKKHRKTQTKRKRSIRRRHSK
jgi:hypothetical protein